MPWLIAFNWLRSSWLGKALAIAAGVLMALALARQSGKRAARGEQREANLRNWIDVTERGRDAKEDAARSVGAMSDDELADSLRKHPGAFRE